MPSTAREKLVCHASSLLFVDIGPQLPDGVLFPMKNRWLVGAQTAILVLEKQIHSEDYSREDGMVYRLPENAARHFVDALEPFER